MARISVQIPLPQQYSSRQLTEVARRVSVWNTKKASNLNLHGIRWGAAVGGALLAEVTQVIAAVLWVAIYSHVLHPGQPMTVYEQHAQASGPWVSIIAGFPIFYFASRWIARSIPTALALFGVFLTIDVFLLLLTGGQSAIAIMWLIGLSYATKLLACYLGGRHGLRQPVEAAR